MNNIKTLTEALNYKSTKSTNDFINKLRESLFVKEFHKHISHIKTRNNNCECDSKIKDVIKKIEEHKIEPKDIIQNGGRSKSYDFTITDIKNTKYILELKVNNNISKSNKLPQLCDIYLSSSNYIIENQYDIFLQAWLLNLENLKKEFNLSSSIPTLEELKNNLCLTDKTSKIQFLNEIYKKYKADSKFKKNISSKSKECVHNFITNNFNKLNKEQIKKIIEEKLNCKNFICLYNQTKEQILVEECTLYKININENEISLIKDRTGKYNTGYSINFTNNSDKYNIKITCSWKNNTGVYGPYFKFGWPNKI